MPIREPSTRGLKLDLERVRQNKPMVPGLTIVAILFPCVIFWFPIVLYSGVNFGRNTGWIVFYVAILFNAAVILFLRLALLRWQTAWSMQAIAIAAFSPFFFFVGAMFLFAAHSAVTLWQTLPILGGWMLLEYRAWLRAGTVPDYKLQADMKKHIRLNGDGPDLYEHSFNMISRLEPSQTTLSLNTRPLYVRAAEYFAYLLLLFGPFLVIYSMILDDNFDARFIIIGIFALLIGSGANYISADTYLLSRALKYRNR